LGITGNSGIDNFASLGQVASRNDYNAVPGLLLDRIGNDDLGWEKNRTLDVGFDFGLFENSLRGSFLYYNRKTYDLLLDVPIPETVGFNKAYITRNAGEMVNKGIEFTLFADILKNNFKWSLGCNISTVDNTVTKLIDNNEDGEDDQIIIDQQIIKTGETLGAFYVVNYAGVDATNGDALFYNLEGTASKNYSSTNRMIISSNIQKYMEGLAVNCFGLDLILVFCGSMLWIILYIELMGNTSKHRWPAYRIRRLINWLPGHLKIPIPKFLKLVVPLMAARHLQGILNQQISFA
jgi:hypothetical protein